jgi:hypothetical protein
MLSYHLADKLSNAELSEWDKLAADYLGSNIHPKGSLVSVSPEKLYVYACVNKV